MPNGSYKWTRSGQIYAEAESNARASGRNIPVGRRTTSRVADGNPLPNGSYKWTRSGQIYAEMIMTTGDPSHARIPGRMYQKLQIVYDRSINEDSTRATTRNAPTLLSISRTSSLMIFRIINQTLPYRCRRCPECCRSRGNFLRNIHTKIRKKGMDSESGRR